MMIIPKASDKVRKIENKKNMKILLASQSPRRKELISALGYDFSTVKN